MLLTAAQREVGEACVAGLLMTGKSMWINMNSKKESEDEKWFLILHVLLLPPRSSAHRLCGSALPPICILQANFNCSITNSHHRPSIGP